MAGLVLAAAALVAVPPAAAAGAAVPGAAAPDFAYEDVNPNSPTHGRRLALSALYAERGLVLNFLASWCGYCWVELPELEALQKTTAVPIVGVAADEHDGPSVLLRRVRAAGLSLPILLVPPADIAAMERAYGHGMLPATYVIDREGKIRRVFEGLAPREVLAREVAERPES